jgi:hypothetical protein
VPKDAAIFLALLLSPSLYARDDDPEPKSRAVKPREIVVKGLPRLAGSSDRPIIVPSEKRLAELVPNEDARASILKQVNFRKEHLLLFCWTGANSDRLTPVNSKAGGANFEITAKEDGKATYHAKLFAVPARAKVKVTTR